MDGSRRAANLLHPGRGVCVLACLAVWLHAVSAPAFEPMLPGVYAAEAEVTGWWMSEKLDGVRGRWDGRRLWSKTGKPLHPPQEFIRGLPGFALEGELWGGRNSFERTTSIVRRKAPHDGWLQLRFAIFDVPGAPGGFRTRIEEARAWLAAHPTPYAYVSAL